ncbi:hypothetical protein [Paenibacillus agricola]|uniref:Amidase n=1 Tax=Paenibacillus agricola TaxID=2716264 RepID=A0ABX0JB62_9BACL|nr:hypothetical protein [Paenibacillus agricola]NHN33742.1 hypothetical protein [Paenibacillus agricola]
MKKKPWVKWSGRLGKTVLGCLLVSQVMTGFTLFGGSESKVEAAEPLVVSTWMWNPFVIEKDQDITLQHLMDQRINRVYLNIDLDYLAIDYSSFIRKAKAKGIEVQALGGAPNWVLPEHNKKMYEFIDWVKQYNNSVQPEERFTGIHLDVEPYVLTQWRQDSDAVIGLWMDTVSGFAEEVKADSDLTVGIDMPTWLDSIRVRDGYGGMTTLPEWLISRLDQVTLMAYFDNADNISQSVQDEINAADRVGVPVLVAVDTVNSGEVGGSFFNKGQVLMRNELAAVVGSLGDHPSFEGYSVHDWDSWMKLGQ